MIAILDVHYGPATATTGCVLIERWRDENITAAHVGQTRLASAYVPGRFYLRELPCLKTMLDHLPALPGVIVIDGHVWLQEGVPGLGHHLFKSLHGQSAVIGVAKSAFKGSWCAARIFRGRSRNPLYVTADGMPKDIAAACIRTMAGPHRIPLMLRRADQLARGRLGDLSNLHQNIEAGIENTKRRSP